MVDYLYPHKISGATTLSYTNFSGCLCNEWTSNFTNNAHTIDVIIQPVPSMS